MLTRIIISTLVFCTFSTLVLQGQDCTVEKSEFNSKESDFSPSYFGEGLVFSSNRAKRILAADEDTLNTYYTDLFYVPLGDDKRKKADLFSRELTGWLNEGPCTFNKDETIIYYTGNIEPEKKKKKIHEYKLGIFKAELKDGKWGEISSFEFNRKEKHNLAHPALSHDDQLMVFTSNLPGGKGATDLYCSVWNGRSWEKPENLGPTVNTKANEMFPWLDEYKNLYFSSDRKDGLGGMDVYCSKYNKGQWGEPEALSRPINSEFDDFAYVHTLGGKKGHFSSNRLDAIDNVFDFTWTDPVFDNCDENRQSIYCYLIEEVELPGADTLPFVYQWDMGDGTIEEGLSVKHCFPGIGEYDIVLNAIDTTTQQMFLRISETKLNIQKFDQPFISSSSLMNPDVEYEFSSSESTVSSFDPDLYYWDFGDGELQFGPHVKHTFKEIGTYRILLGASSRPNKDGIRQNHCTYKTVVVTNEEFVPDNDIQRELEIKEYKKLEMKPAQIIEGVMADAVLVDAYRVVLMSSKKQIAIDDEMFSSIDEEIIVEYDDVTERYVYSTSLMENLSDTYELFNELEKSDFKEPKVFKIGVVDYQLSAEKFEKADSLSYTFNIDDELFVHLDGNSMMVDTLSEGFDGFISNFDLIEIDFGDGTVMNESFKEHKFILPGTYEVILKMVSKDDINHHEYERSVSIIIEDTPIPVLAEEIETNEENLNEEEQAGTDVLLANLENINPDELSIENDSLNDEDLEGLNRNIQVQVNELSAVSADNNTAGTGSLEEQYSENLHDGMNEKSAVDEDLAQSEEIILNADSAESIDVDLNETLADTDKHDSQNSESPSNELGENLSDELTLRESTEADLNAESIEAVESMAHEKNEIIDDVITSSEMMAEKSAELDKMAIDMHLVQFISSEERIPFNNPQFADIDDEILEVKNDSSQNYDYCIGPFDTQELAQLGATKLNNLGMTSRLMQMEENEIEKSIVKRGHFIPNGDAVSLNYEFTGLSDIQFEYNSSSIKEESFGNLDYIVAMLALESDFILRIQAHTCNIGGSDYNLDLSDARASSVLEYIADKGIDASRFRAKGFGDVQPKESNATEKGRIRNRRVEFTIVFAPEVTDLSMVK